MSVLIVDDVSDNIIILQSFLKQAGITDTITANSAKETYEKMGLEGTLQSSDVDLLLLDVMMPEINGIDVCKRLKSEERVKDVPIIMVTARTDMESLQVAFNAGAMDYITKPVRKVELLARVHSALKLRDEMNARKRRELELKLRNDELEQAMKEIKTLKGFIPICASCKKVRNDDGFWQQVEAYIQQHSEAKFSHGICEDCMKTNYPDLRKEQT